jgi:hypothetical protein
VPGLDVRLTLRTDDGQLIYTRYHGILEIPPAARAWQSRGERLAPEEYYWRVAFTFETASEKYGWLNRIIAIGAGEVGLPRPEYSVYVVR